MSAMCIITRGSAVQFEKPPNPGLDSAGATQPLCAIRTTTGQAGVYNYVCTQRAGLSGPVDRESIDAGFEKLQKYMRLNIATLPCLKILLACRYINN